MACKLLRESRGFCLFILGASPWKLVIAYVSDAYIPASRGSDKVTVSILIGFHVTSGHLKHKSV